MMTNKDAFGNGVLAGIAHVAGLRLEAPARQIGQGSGWQHWTPADGLPEGQVSKLFFAEDGGLWAMTDAGLAQFDGATWSAFPLPVGTLNGLARAGHNALWLATAEGLLHLGPEEASE